MPSKQVVIIEGDGIGPEITEAVLYILDKSGADIDWLPAAAGQKAIDQCGEALPRQTLDSIGQTGVALKAPIATPIGSGTGASEIGFRSVNVALRQGLNLYANVRPIVSLPNLETRYKNIDLVFIRENTEGLYSGLEHEIVPGIVTSLKVSTESACMKIAEFAFDYAKKMGRKKITGIHKANIMKLSDGLALKCYRSVAEKNSEIQYDEKIIDAAAMHLVLDPYQFDVLLMENLYGDILSDLGAGLIGGLGLAPSANIGRDCAVFEAVHGSAPDIAGRQLANPTALLLSAVEMLSYIGQQAEADRIRRALYTTFSHQDDLTGDLGGKSSTMEFAKAVAARIE